MTRFFVTDLGNTNSDLKDNAMLVAIGVPASKQAAFCLCASATALAVAAFCASAALAQESNMPASNRAVYEKVYIPAYSRVMTHEGLSQPLATTMVVHNIDPELEIEIIRVDYFDRDGRKVRSFLEEPSNLSPFQSRHFLVPINEQSGGFGANYIVEWEASKPALSPIMEAVMVGGTGTHGISFTSTGRIIDRIPE